MGAERFCELCRVDRPAADFMESDDVCRKCGGGVMVACSGRDCSSRIRRKWGDDVSRDPLCGVCRQDVLPGHGKGPHLVYFIRCGDFIKIGFTRGRAQLDERVKTLQIGNPFDLEVVDWIVGNWRLEQFLHEKFDHLHHQGEWFRADPELERFIARHGMRSAA